MTSTSRLIAVSDASHIGEVRRAAQALAKAMEFSEADAGNIAIVATELAGNLVKHADGGEIVFRELYRKSGCGVEILSLDQGKGMANVNQCMEDGYSTAGSPGTGLGAIERLSDEFDIYSSPDKGTAIMVRFWKSKADAAAHDFLLGAISLPYPGETVCGDGWAAIQHRSSLQILMVDGLGHGQFAADAARESERLFNDDSHHAPTELMQILHEGLRSTRGAAAALTEIDYERGVVRFAGIGNIAGFIFGGPKERGLASYNGILGHQMKKIQEINMPWPHNGLIILHSDGLGTKWKLDDYPGLRSRHPALIAGILYRDFQRKRDDVTIFVARAA